MDYDFRTRAGPPYDSQIPGYRPTTSTATHPMYGHPSLYPKVGQPGSHPVNPLAGAARNPSFQPASTACMFARTLNWKRMYMFECLKMD